MFDGEGKPDETLRATLYTARRIASQGKNAVLVYLIEAALAELDENGLDPTFLASVPTRGAA